MQRRRGEASINAVQRADECSIDINVSRESIRWPGAPGGIINRAVITNNNLASIYRLTIVNLTIISFQRMNESEERRNFNFLFEKEKLLNIM